jgi:hypothetical protein
MIERSIGLTYSASAHVVYIHDEGISLAYILYSYKTSKATLEPFQNILMANRQPGYRKYDIK